VDGTPEIIETVGEEIVPFVEPAPIVAPTPATVTEQPAPEVKRTPWGWIVGGSAAALAVLGGGVYLATRKRARRRRG
jgi:hypothetical protein